MSRDKKPHGQSKKEITKVESKEVNQDEISIEVAEVISDLPKAKQEVIIKALSIKQSQHSGPLPDGDTIKIYSEVIPNGGDRLMATVEKQLEHRIKIESTGVKRSFNQSAWGSRLWVYYCFIFWTYCLGLS